MSSLFHSEEFDELASITGLPEAVCCTFNESEVLSDFQIWRSPGFQVQSGPSTSGSLPRHLDTKFVIGFDFAVTLSSPESSCVLFDITSRQVVDLKWLMLNKHKKMVPLITCEISLCQSVCELVFGANVFDLDLGVQIDSIKQPIKSNSVGSGNMSHCRTPSFNDHLDHCFVVLKDIQQSFLTRRMHV